MLRSLSVADPDAARRWSRFWLWMSFVVTLPLVSLIATRALGVRTILDPLIGSGTDAAVIKGVVLFPAFRRSRRPSCGTLPATSGNPH